ncbi:MAG: N-6 DNA methylase, partial [Bacteroidales bacterium]|nr:N-6 DNA methylase [Bacteroidales bacterium]
MAFFQNSVLHKHLKTLDKEVVSAAYTKFEEYFKNPEIQQNIRDAKEEQFQEGFLRELFVNILGYSLNPQPNYNLTTELKNEKGAKKADGAILQDGKALAVIELKGTDTKDLDKINVQAFNYKNNQTGCVYVITSNFEKLRFFIHHSVEHLEFNLFTLTETEFQLLWLCLSAENLFKATPLKIKEESLLEEEKITKQLYKDYAAFRMDLWQNMIKNNTESDKLLLFKKTQKLLDRYLFIFFAEDSGLLPPNSISRIVKRWEILQEEDAYKPLYDIFKQYFGYIDTGRKGQKTVDDIFAYNGGLFQPDELLDNIVLNDEVLHPHVMKLTNYDFQSEVDVNILGHIFENSLNEIENITAQLEGQEIDKSKTKRKKDGVFYTPKYITKYIVDNTVGKLCDEKKAELGVIDEKYAKGRRNRKKYTVKKLDNSLEAYREWLLLITICDPACGSGAFLNQALEFLMEEHAYIDELQAQLFGASIVFQDVSDHILEKNIYGVDINDESVDIAKLSLWLRTAQRGRKLTTLNNNIKCGNSLIDDPEVAGEKAFNWHKEFPDIYKKKEKKAWHVTTAIHNSRYSQRMFDNHVKLDEPIWLSEKDELVITRSIAEIIKEDKLNMLEYNICGDHMHILLVCGKEELPAIVGKLKAVSGRKCNIARGITIPARTPPDTSAISPTTRGHVPLSYSESDIASDIAMGNSTSTDKEKKKYNSLWTQKFGRREITNKNDLKNVIEYIKNNRKKHKLPENREIRSLAKEMCCSHKHAFRTEYKGGFDVVIGNPPYGAYFSEEEKQFITIKYKSYQYKFESYLYFYEKGIDILKEYGFLSFITPELFLRLDKSENIRRYLLDNSVIYELKFCGENVFADVKVNSVILTLTKSESQSKSFKIVPEHDQSWDYEFIRWKNSPLIKIEYKISSIVKVIIEKIEANSVDVGSFGEAIQGLTPYDS